MSDPTADRLPMRQVDLTDTEQLRAWLADRRVHHPGADEFDEAVSGVIARLGREDQKLPAAWKAKGRGQRGGARRLGGIHRPGDHRLGRAGRGPSHGG